MLTSGRHYVIFHLVFSTTTYPWFQKGHSEGVIKPQVLLRGDQDVLYPVWNTCQLEVFIHRSREGKGWENSAFVTEFGLQTQSMALDSALMEFPVILQLKIMNIRFAINCILPQSECAIAVYKLLRQSATTKFMSPQWKHIKSAGSYLLSTIKSLCAILSAQCLKNEITAHVSTWQHQTDQI